MTRKNMMQMVRQAAGSLLGRVLRVLWHGYLRDVLSGKSDTQASSPFGRVVTGKNAVAYCGNCERETLHKRGRRCRWHCLVCDTEHVRLKPTGKAKSGLPPGFLLEKNVDGELYLYMAMPAVEEGKGEKESRYYLKGAFPGDTTRREIESHAWEAYRR